MADELNFTKQEELEEWLQDKPVELARVIAARAALRVLPIVGRVFNSTLSAIDKDKLILSTYRACLITLAGRIYPAESKVFTATASASATAAAAATGAASHTDASAASIATGAATAAAFGVAAVPATGAAVSATGAAATGASTFATDIWGTTSQDSNWLMVQEGDAAEQARQLASTKLWPGGEPGWVYKERTELNRSLIRQSKSHSVWIKWYSNVLNGDPFFNLPPAREKTLTLKIAQQENKFWEQDFAKVGEDISGWLVRAQKEVAEEAAQRQLDQEVDPGSISEPEPQKQSAVRFISDDDEPIGIDYLADVDSLLNDEAASDRHSEVSRLADAMINSYDPTEKGANSASKLIKEVTHYRQSLGDSPLEAKPDLLVPRGDALRMELEAHKNKDEDFSDLPPISDKYILALEKIVKAHNPYVNFDPTLVTRDEALLGPDAKANLVSPEEGRKFIENAVAQNVAKPEVEEVLAEEAKVAPDIPDPDNRKSRRYSEGVKNFARKALSVVWNNKGKVLIGIGSTPPAVIAIGKWMIANEVWFMALSPKGSVMYETILQLFQILKTLPLL